MPFMLPLWKKDNVWAIPFVVVLTKGVDVLLGVRASSWHPIPQPIVGAKAGLISKYQSTVERLTIPTL